jgi:hypothetical protein
MYQCLNGDVTGAIERLNYYNDSKEWEKENSPSLIDFINKINETESTYDVFDYIPQKSEPFQFKVLELLYNFYSSFAPGELDNIVSGGNEEYFNEIKMALIEVDAMEFVTIFESYIQAVREENRLKREELDEILWNTEEGISLKIKTIYC